jgi:hypothetical protein
MNQVRSVKISAHAVKNGKIMKRNANSKGARSLLISVSPSGDELLEGLAKGEAQQYREPGLKKLDRVR